MNLILLPIITYLLWFGFSTLHLSLVFITPKKSLVSDYNSVGHPVMLNLLCLFRYNSNPRYIMLSCRRSTCNRFDRIPMLVSSIFNCNQFRNINRTVAGHFGLWISRVTNRIHLNFSFDPGRHYTSNIILQLCRAVFVVFLPDHFLLITFVSGYQIDLTYYQSSVTFSLSPFVAIHLRSFVGLAGYLHSGYDDDPIYQVSHRILLGRTQTDMVSLHGEHWWDISESSYDYILQTPLFLLETVGVCLIHLQCYRKLGKSFIFQPTRRTGTSFIFQLIGRTLKTNWHIILLKSCRAYKLQNEGSSTKRSYFVQFLISALCCCTLFTFMFVFNSDIVIDS